MANRTATMRRPASQLPAGARVTAEDAETWELLVAASTLLRKEVDRTLAPWKTTAAQAQALALVDLAGRPLPVTELARAMLQESPSVTRLVDRMTARGFVTRLDDPTDRRRALVALTDVGRVHLEQIRPPGAAAANEAFGVLSRREQATLKRLLRKFSQAALRRVELT